jgi:hypothetical protein
MATAAPRGSGWARGRVAREDRRHAAGSMANRRTTTRRDMCGASFSVTGWRLRFGSVAATCHDYPSPLDLAAPADQRRAQYDRALAAIASKDFGPFTPAGWFQSGVQAAPACLGWPVDPTAGSPLQGRPLPDVPALVESGDLDTNAPIEMGRQAAAQFPHATFAVIANAGHTLDTEPCDGDRLRPPPAYRPAPLPARRQSAGRGRSPRALCGTAVRARGTRARAGAPSGRGGACDDRGRRVRRAVRADHRALRRAARGPPRGHQARSSDQTRPCGHRRPSQRHAQPSRHSRAAASAGPRRSARPTHAALRTNDYAHHRHHGRPASEPTNASNGDEAAPLRDPSTRRRS